MQIYDDYLTAEVLEEWVESTERVIGAGLKKNGVWVSDPARANIRIKIIESIGGIVELHFVYRDSLRFSEMGAGNGYHKGTRVTSQQYRQALDKGRKRKKILMKPIFRRIAGLQTVVAAKLIQDISNDFQKLKDGISN